MLEHINLFPETRYLRAKRSPQLDHKCGGISSLAILVTIISILIFQLHQAFQMRTIYFTKQTEVTMEPFMTNLSTFATEYQSPYMMAIFPWNRRCDSVKFNVTANMYYHRNNTSIENQVVFTEPFYLETCTKEHFQNIPVMQKVAEQQNISDWFCLPLNKSTTIGGHFELSVQFSALQIKIACTGACDPDSCGTALIYHVTTLVNPNNEVPFEYILKREQMDLTMNTFNAYAIRINENIVVTDQSLLPLPNKIIQKSFSTNPIEYRASILKNNPSFTVLWIQRSVFTDKIQRRYMKLIDVASYAGGIFPTLFGFFFFMKFFGMYFFDMTFAYRHFKEETDKKVYFPHFIKYAAFKILRRIGYEPKTWKIAKKQVKVTEIINELLDINYLFKRIEFLEFAIQSLMEDYQLKGIYLSKINLKMAENQYKKHRIRDRIITFLNKGIEEKIVEEERQSYQKNNQIVEDEKQSPARNNINPMSGSQSGKNMMNSIYLDDIRPPKKMIQVQPSLEGQLAKSQSEDSTSPQRKLQIKLFNLRQEKRVTDNISQSQLDEAGLKAELDKDLRKLFMEARKKNGDPISKRIVERMDPWLKQEIEIAIEDVGLGGPMEQLYRDLS